MKATRAVRTPGGRECAAASGPVEVAGANYRAARRGAAGTSNFMLRWGYRKLARRRSEGELGDGELFELRAVTDELLARRQELPEVSG